jgi:hypothetical protein
MSGGDSAGRGLSEGLGPLYAERDHVAQGELFVRHMSAMTGEGLHAKSAIAAELAHRDMEIQMLRAALGAVHWRVSRSDTAFDDIAAAVLAEVCEQACPALRALRA